MERKTSHGRNRSSETNEDPPNLVTDAAATEGIDRLPEEDLRPIVVADHGSANTAEYTRENIEVLGLDLWPCRIGRPTGNARTE